VSDEVQIEPVPGLPDHLPPGEKLLWQGRPTWKGLARHTFQVQWLSVYFTIFIVARGLMVFSDGKSLAQAILASLFVTPLAAACLAVLCLLAWLNARSTIYTITSKRVVMRFGVAFPITFNLPFKWLASASLKTRKDGEGDIALELAGKDRLAYLNLWPHARPWRLAKAQPMLRSIPDAGATSALLGEAVKAWGNAEAAAVVVSTPVVSEAGPMALAGHQA
jgi:hypothetical protein